MTIASRLSLPSRPETGADSAFSSDSSTLQASAHNACPGLFCPTPAQDGSLSRLRMPGGHLNALQAHFIADLVEQQAIEQPDNCQILITNRANLQLRLAAPLDGLQLQACQDQGLAGPMPAVDHLRNIMASPTAGIDAKARLDIRPLVQEIDRYIANNAGLAGLSAKFSIGIDGGESVSVRHRANDLWLVAESNRIGSNDSALMRLFLGLGENTEVDTGIAVRPDRAVALIDAIANLYLDRAAQFAPVSNQHRRSQKPRLRDLVAHWGVDWWMERLGGLGGLQPTEVKLPDGLRPAAGHRAATTHLGVHPQSQPGLAYVGVVVPLGALSSQRLRSLAHLSTTYGSGSLRLTPWQTILIPDVPIAHIPAVKQALIELGCSTDATHPAAGIVACAGKPGCAAALTHTHAPAQALIQRLLGQLDQPINIHVSGCAKACAQAYASDIALLGVALEDDDPAAANSIENRPTEGYEIYLKSGSQPFGQKLYRAMPISQAIDQVAHMVRIYQSHRYSPDESFSQFTQRHPLLHALFAVPAN